MTVVLFVAAALAVLSPTDAIWPEVVAHIESGVATNDVPTLRLAMLDAARIAAAATTPRDRELALYAEAYVAWRMSTIPGMQAAESRSLLDDASKRLGEVIKSNDKSGEARALLASVLGNLIRFGGNKMVLGPEAQALRDEALSLEPNNPRVMLQAAVTTYHTPAEYGGGVAQAEAALRHAIALFEREPAARPWPNWGRFDAHAWLGQALAARGDKAGARTEYNLALEQWPKSGWVKFVLMPALDK
jgi:tetratricopeptide (TPR) repeat protein